MDLIFQIHDRSFAGDLAHTEGGDCLAGWRCGELLDSGGGRAACEQLVGGCDHFFRADGLSQNADAVGGKFGWSFFDTAKHKDGYVGKTRVHLGHERWSAEARHVQVRDNEAKLTREVWLLDHAEGFYRVSDALHVVELLFQRGHTHRGLKWIIIN